VTFCNEEFTVCNCKFILFGSFLVYNVSVISHLAVVELSLACIVNIVDCRLLLVMGQDFVSALQHVAYYTVPR
jgi:hypothetical protein